MAPTGHLAFGNIINGVLKNWIKLQQRIWIASFSVADWHALTTQIWKDSRVIEEVSGRWLLIGACRYPSLPQSSLFLQSRVPETCRAAFIVSMINPLSWLERVPTYKDQQEKLKEKDLSTNSLWVSGYPLLQSADILIYRAGQVPVGEDQVVHVELTREIAADFKSTILRREKTLKKKAEAAVKKMGKKNAKLYNHLRDPIRNKVMQKLYKPLVNYWKNQQSLATCDMERLFGFPWRWRKVILPEPSVADLLLLKCQDWTDRSVLNPMAIPFHCENQKSVGCWK